MVYAGDLPGSHEVAGNRIQCTGEICGSLLLPEIGSLTAVLMRSQRDFGEATHHPAVRAGFLAPPFESNHSVADSTPRVSIGLPVYNGERFLPPAIDSLLAQTFKDFELILSDNASTDRTEQICRDYAACDPRVRYFRNETNIGPLRNFLRVVELSSAEF